MKQPSYSSLSSEGSKPNIRTYHIIIKGFCKEGRLNQAQYMLHEMEKNGITPDDFILNIMAKGFLVLKNHSHKVMAMQLMNTMAERGFPLHAQTLSVLLDASQNSVELEKFLRFLPGDITKGNIPNTLKIL